MSARIENIINLLVEDEDETDWKELYALSGYETLRKWMKEGVLTLTGKVVRNNLPYVHERTTGCEIYEEWNFREEDGNDDERLQIEEQCGKLINKLQQEIDRRMVEWNKKIYRELEIAFEDDNSEEVVRSNIEANEWLFDENGVHDEDGMFAYDDLGEEAKKRALEEWRTASREIGDTYYAEPVILEWKWLLKNKGFDGVDISFSGFWSQGDGASFTANSIDFERYFNGPDPLTFPEEDRDQLSESEEKEGQEDDLKDIAFPSTAIQIAEEIRKTVESLPGVVGSHILDLEPTFGDDLRIVKGKMNADYWSVCEALRPVADSFKSKFIDVTLRIAFNDPQHAYDRIFAFSVKEKRLKESGPDDSDQGEGSIKDVAYPSSRIDAFVRWTFDDYTPEEKEQGYENVWDTAGPFYSVSTALEWAQRTLAWKREKMQAMEITVVRRPLEGRAKPEDPVIARYYVDQDFQLRKNGQDVTEPLGESDSDDFTVKELAEPSQRWLYEIFDWPTAKSISYFVIDDPRWSYVPGVRDYPPTVGTQTFPKRSKDSDLRLVAQAQIRQFKRAGRYDRAQWKDVWEWLRDFRAQNRQKE